MFCDAALWYPSYLLLTRRLEISLPQYCFHYDNVLRSIHQILFTGQRFRKLMHVTAHSTNDRLNEKRVHRFSAVIVGWEGWNYPRLCFKPYRGYTYRTATDRSRHHERKKMLLVWYVIWYEKKHDTWHWYVLWYVILTYIKYHVHHVIYFIFMVYHILACDAWWGFLIGCLKSTGFDHITLRIRMIYISYQVWYNTHHAALMIWYICFFLFFF